MQANTKCLSVRALGVALFTLALAASSAWAADPDCNWVTNNYFSVDATTGEKVKVNGDWSLNEPQISSSKFAIDSTQSVFTVTEIKTNDYRKIIQIDAEMEISDYYYQADLGTDVPSAIAGISLTTNEAAASSVSWYVLVNGADWTQITTADVATDLATYTVRAELDYTTAATPFVRYLVKKSGADGFTVLTTSTVADGWFSAKANAASVKDVCFCGKADLTTLSSKLGTTAAAEVNYVEYDSALDAMAAGNQNIVLYENDTVTSSQLNNDTYAGKTYTFVGDTGKSLTVTASSWKASNGTGVTVQGSGTATITVSAKTPLAAKVLGNDDPDAYLTLAEAFDAVKTTGKTVVLMKDVAESTTLPAGTTFDLGGFALTKKSETAPILTINAANAVITNGYIVMAPSGYAAISATGSATVTLDDVAITNVLQNAIAISAASGTEITINNGLYTGAFNGGGAFTILGGYFLANDAQAMTLTGVTATGGKFTADAATALGAPYTGYKLAALAVPFTTNGFTIAKEVMVDVKDSESKSVDTAVYSVTDDNGEQSIGGVQIPTAWAQEKTGETEASAVQTALNEEVTYVGTQKIKKWECYVLGIDPSTSEKMKEGPVVKGVQDAPAGKIGFTLKDSDAIKAEASGCDVKFSVTPCKKPDLSDAETESDKVDYAGTINLDVPTDGVRYYKLKMYISPKK